MSLVDKNSLILPIKKDCALECGFPAAEISKTAEYESWRKEVNRPIYHIHKWWATRLGTVFRAIALAALSKPEKDIWNDFYEYHDFKGKIILDPFMGSGTTLGEALKIGASAIGCDINPVSSYLVKQAFTHVSEEALRATYNKIENNVSKIIKKYYTTICPNTNEEMESLYYFWVKIAITPDGEEIPLFSRYVFSQNVYPNKKPLSQIICPHCWNISVDNYNTTLISCDHCESIFNPQNGPVNGQYVTSKHGKKFKIKELLPQDGTPFTERPYAVLAKNKKGEKFYLPFTQYDQKLFESACQKLNELDLPLPNQTVRAGHNTNQAIGYNYKNWQQFFNKRQLLCLGLLLEEILKIEDLTLQEQFLCLFSGTLEFNNMFCSFKGEGTGAVRHMFSNHILKPERTPLENSVWGSSKSSGTFSTLFESRLIKAKRYLDSPFELKLAKDDSQKTSTSKIIASHPMTPVLADSWTSLISNDKSLMILNGDSADLKIPSKSVDAVITDPPYFDFVHYSELSDFFYSWLSPVLSSRYEWFQKQSSHDEGEVQQKDPIRFSQQLTRVFTECTRVLKDNGTLTFSFHHSKPEGWAAIYEAIINAGLYIVAVHPVHAESKSAAPKNLAKNPISLDAILVCKKQHISLEEFSSEELQDIDRVANTLKKNGLTVSEGDLFVIGASLVLMRESRAKLNYLEIKKKLDELLEIIIKNQLNT